MSLSSPSPATTPTGTIAGRIAGLALLGVLVGGLASFGAIAFVEAVAWLNDALLVSPRARILHDDAPWRIAFATVVVPAMAGLVSGLIVRYGVRERRPLGPADSILAVQSPQPPPSVRSGLASTAAAVLALGGGASVGQYGPMVYLGTVAGVLATRLGLPVANLRAICVGCGVAAAISTAFNAPIAGLVFAHEIILRHYAMQAFAPATVASATGYVIANVIFERPALFLVSFDGVRHSHEFALFAIEGVLCAGFAVLFMRSLVRCSTFAAGLAMPAALKPALAGLILGIVALWIPEVLGIGQETLRFATIENAFALDELALLIAAKLAVTVLCLGFGFAGGVFSPALLIGVLFGALFGATVQSSGMVPTSHIMVYAVSGMMAVASPVIGAPLTTIIIVFELTRSYDLTIAAMVAVVFSNLVAYRVFGRSLFDVQLARRGFDLSAGRDEALLRSVPVRAVMCSDYPAATPDESIRDALARLTASGRSECVVVGHDGGYVGLLRVQDVSIHNQDARVGSVSVAANVVFDERTSIGEAMERLRGFVGEAVPVVNSTDGRLLGVAPESAIIEAYLDRVRALRREEHESV